jgi:hypothetical protein
MELVESTLATILVFVVALWLLHSFLTPQQRATLGLN